MARSKIAVYPGSFDPITNGHIDLIERSLQIFDRIIVAIATNPNKEDSLFGLEERLEMIREAVKGLGTRVQVDSFQGLLVDYAERIGAGVIVRGLRAVSDFEYEFQMAMMNRELNTRLETLFMMTGDSYFYLSSRLVKEVVELGGDVSAFVPKNVLKRLKAKFGR
ncbi:MAG: pantetheine-phosphate adenylyltransferase [Candidatus Binatia bacterium]